MSTDRIRPVTRGESVDRIDSIPRTRLLSPAEREEARKRRQMLREERAAKERQGRADHHP